MNLLIEISAFSKIILIPSFLFLPVVFGTLPHKTALSNDTIKKVHQLCFGGHLMTMIKDIFKPHPPPPPLPPAPQKMLCYICIFHVLGLVNPSCIAVGSFPVFVTREVNKNPLLTHIQKSLQDHRMAWLLPKLILKPSELFGERALHPDWAHKIASFDRLVIGDLITINWVKRGSASIS